MGGVTRVSMHCITIWRLLQRRADDTGTCRKGTGDTAVVACSVASCALSPSAGSIRRNHGKHERATEELEGLYTGNGRNGVSL